MSQLRRGNFTMTREKLRVMRIMWCFGIAFAAVAIPYGLRHDRLHLWLGTVVFILSVFQLLRTRKQYASLPANPPRPAARPRKSELSAEPFLTWEPASNRKLNCFPDKDCLLEVLGHGGKKLQDWEPEDRAIDYSGHLFRLAPNPARTQYNLEAVDEVWTWQTILNLAAQDAAVIKKNPDALRQKVEHAPEPEKIRAIMQGVDELPGAPVWFWPCFILFLVLWFVAVVSAAGWVVMRLMK